MKTRRSWMKNMVVATGGAAVGLAAVGKARKLDNVDNVDNVEGVDGVGSIGDTDPAVPQTPASPGITGPAPVALLQPLQPGSALGHGWSLASIGEIEYGAASLALRHDDGRTAHVALCRRNDNGGSLARTELFDMVLLNGTQERPVATEELLGRVVRAIAGRVQANETPAALHAGFLTHEARMRQYGQGIPA